MLGQIRGGGTSLLWKGSHSLLPVKSQIQDFGRQLLDMETLYSYTILIMTNDHFAMFLAIHTGKPA